MAGKIKANPRYEVVSFRTTSEQKELLNHVRGQYSISEFVDLLLTLYLSDKRDDHGTTCVGPEVCTA